MRINAQSQQALLKRVLASECELDASSLIWKLANQPALPYPNDSFASHDLEGILRKTADLSSLSYALEQQASHWPASYYLSPERTSLLRGFEWTGSSTVLEVGAGCGTITRFLGETFDEVLAVEGEPHRARMARLRTHDLQNVTVLSAPWAELNFEAQFDLVFCIGVLEYATLFSSEVDAPRDMAKSLRDVVAPGGTLVLAIENQLGLKYFAGADEDHTGIAFDGIEGYHRSRGQSATTFSRNNIEELLSDAGFATSQFFFPFPDYKFASCIFDDVAIKQSRIPSLSGLATHQKAQSYSSPGRPSTFDQELAWREIFAAGLASDLANSFLIFASRDETSTSGWSHDWNAASFSLRRRRPEFRSRTTLHDIDTLTPKLKRVALSPESTAATGWLEVTLPQEQAWYTGNTLYAEVRAIMQSANCTSADIAHSLRPWRSFLEQHMTAAKEVDGTCYDATPRNLVEVDGQLELLDREIRVCSPVPVNIILIRGLHQLLMLASESTETALSLRGRRYWSVIKQISAELGVRLTFADAASYVHFERRIQGIITDEFDLHIVLLGRLLAGRLPFSIKTLAHFKAGYIRNVVGAKLNKPS